MTNTVNSLVVICSAIAHTSRVIAKGQRVHFDLPKGALDIYENTGPGNGEKFTVAPLILPYKTVHGPVSAWSKILHEF